MASGSLSTSQEITDTKFLSQVLGPQKVAKLGDTIVLTVKEAAPNGAVKKGQVRHGVVVRSAVQSSRYGGFGIKFDDNAVVLIDSKTKERGQHSTKKRRRVNQSGAEFSGRFWKN